MYNCYTVSKDKVNFNYRSMNKVLISSVIAAIAVIFVFSLMLFLQNRPAGEDTRQVNDPAEEPYEVVVQESFGNKIVYATDNNADIEALRRDCSDRQGIFNECGTMCASDATVCATVCAYTCEELGRVQGAEQTGTQTDAVLDDRIRVSTPDPESMIFSPLTISGQARGSWFFEATFPVILTNWDGLIIAEGYAEAKGEWMTQDFVPFEATLDFESPYKTGDPDFMKRGSLILQRANPSGLPENDAALEYTIMFAAGNK